MSVLLSAGTLVARAMIDTIDAQLLAAIRQHPDDDAPRLVYADWLEERGELARARLIALLCRIAALPAWEREAVEARREVDVLVCDHGERWRDELPSLDGVAWTTFARGFVDGVRVPDVATLYRHTDAIRAVATVSRVEIERVGERKREPPDGGVRWLRTLRLRDGERYYRGHRVLLASASELELVDGSSTR